MASNPVGRSVPEPEADSELKEESSGAFEGGLVRTSSDGRKYVVSSELIRSKVAQKQMQLAKRRFPGAKAVGEVQGVGKKESDQAKELPAPTRG